jgi:hypothetical protein
VITRTQRRTVEFRRAFLLKGIDRILPAGKYDIASDEELIEGLSFPVYRRVSTNIFVPSASQASAIEMVAVDPRDLQAAQDQDAGTQTMPVAETSGARVPVNDAVQPK